MQIGPREHAYRSGHRVGMTRTASGPAVGRPWMSQPGRPLRLPVRPHEIVGVLRTMPPRRGPRPDRGPRRRPPDDPIRRPRRASPSTNAVASAMALACAIGSARTSDIWEFNCQGHRPLDWWVPARQVAPMCEPSRSRVGQCGHDQQIESGRHDQLGAARSGSSRPGSRIDFAIPDRQCD